MVFKKQDWVSESEEERIDRESAETDFTYDIMKDLKLNKKKKRKTIGGYSL